MKHFGSQIVGDHIPISSTQQLIASGQTEGEATTTHRYFKLNSAEPLVDAEQTGFVPDRKIEDNILTLRMAEEWSRISGEANLFIKLDFTKAFDRVSFTFLWHTLSSMGFPESMIARIRGLMSGGSSKVLANQAFSRNFKIKRGVRQGCPLAPLLFVLSTQPLMKTLRKEEEMGQLKGLQIPGYKSVLHELFAEDTSLFLRAQARDFTQVRKAIEKFELASGALLNVQKSLVMALGESANNGWLKDSGCEVADHRRRFKFLGVWSGKGITQAEITERIVESIDRKLRSWVNKHLTFTSRLLLIKHILSAIPSHHLRISKAYKIPVCLVWSEEGTHPAAGQVADSSTPSLSTPGTTHQVI
ncbi:hypothetical protein R1sor_000574 [Riccia sorocarpa]|uniref:Reverse transcriptase domain-containing protein n=1 Tax=Riccia sorocarpa TaxID=122646 RepID=A0ABD3GWK0_9MARC